MSPLAIITSWEISLSLSLSLNMATTGPHGYIHKLCKPIYINRGLWLTLLSNSTHLPQKSKFLLLIFYERPTKSKAKMCTNNTEKIPSSLDHSLERKQRSKRSRVQVQRDNRFVSSHRTPVSLMKQLFSLFNILMSLFLKIVHIYFTWT